MNTRRYDDAFGVDLDFVAAFDDEGFAVGTENDFSNAVVVVVNGHNVRLSTAA